LASTRGIIFGLSYLKIIFNIRLRDTLTFPNLQKKDLSKVHFICTQILFEEAIKDKIASKRSIEDHTIAASI